MRFVSLFPVIYHLKALVHFLLKPVNAGLLSLDFNGECNFNVPARLSTRRTTPLTANGNCNFKVRAC